MVLPRAKNEIVSELSMYRTIGPKPFSAFTSCDELLCLLGQGREHSLLDRHASGRLGLQDVLLLVGLSSSLLLRLLLLLKTGGVHADGDVRARHGDETGGAT